MCEAEMAILHISGSRTRNPAVVHADWLHVTKLALVAVIIAQKKLWLQQAYSHHRSVKRKNTISVPTAGELRRLSSLLVILGLHSLLPEKCHD